MVYRRDSGLRCRQRPELTGILYLRNIVHISPRNQPNLIGFFQWTAIGLSYLDMNLILDA